MNQEAIRSPAVDAAYIEMFVATVFGEPRRGIVAARCFSEKGREWRGSWTPYIGPNERLVETLVRIATLAAESQLSCSIVPGLVAGKRARAEDVRGTRVILIDLDHGDIAKKREHLVRHLGEPTLEVASGGVAVDGQMRLHLYWQLTEMAAGEAVGRVCRVRALTALKVGADLSFQSSHQPIRLPGSVYLKGATPKIVQVLKHRPTALPLDEIERAIVSMPALELEPRYVAGSRRMGRLSNSVDHVVSNRAGSRGFDFNSVMPRPASIERLRSMVVREGGVDGITRHDALSKVIGSVIRQVRYGVLTIDEARQSVEEYNRDCLAPPWEAWKVHREFDALLRFDIARHGRMTLIVRRAGS